jgi:cyclase
MRIKLMAVLGLVSLMSVPAVFAQDAFANTKITSQHLNQSVYMLTGMGGNIGVSAGDDGILIIDDQFAPLADKIAAAIGDISKTKMKYLVNTHYHGDHTGSNTYFNDVQNTTIFAHANVRTRLAADKEVKASA